MSQCLCTFHCVCRIANLQYVNTTQYYRPSRCCYTHPKQCPRVRFPPNAVIANEYTQLTSSLMSGHPFAVDGVLFVHDPTGTASELISFRVSTLPTSKEVPARALRSSERTQSATLEQAGCSTSRTTSMSCGTSRQILLFRSSDCALISGPNLVFPNTRCRNA